MLRNKPLAMLLLMTGLWLSACSQITEQNSNKPTNEIVVSGTVTPANPPGSDQSKNETARIELVEAKQLYDDQGAIFVDVRSLQAYNQSHIPGSVSIPLDEISTRGGELNSDDWIITY
jgi:3-mercaptopyruvate sulfurtransferase SseA